MELTYRRGPDAFVPCGAYRRLEVELREHAAALAEVPAVVLSCLDPRTRMLPFVLYDRMIFPAGARAVAGALLQAGFSRTRAVFQLWNPNFRPGQARIDGRPVQMLLVSSMQIHGDAASAAIRDAWTMGDDRPLILAGGPKAHYEPYTYWPQGGPDGPIGPDVVCTGEAYVLLDLLRVLVAFHRKGEHIRRAFERARLSGALNGVPGLVYLAPGASHREPALVDTGLQRLVQHLDEMPHEVSGLSVLEPPGRKAGLATAPLADGQVRAHARICSLLVTQGCKFNCSYCPIPAVNQKTWRFRSPEGLARELASVRERFGIKYYFGTDDNFFNRRQTALEFFEVLARTRIARGKRLGHQVRWGTEATQHDTWKNRDLLPLARKAGLAAVWFGIEDLTADLVNKGQKPEVTAELFPLMHRHQILPMAMMMFHETQPFASPGSLAGITNQIDFLRNAGAVTVQVTIHNPAAGTREYERTFESGRVLARLGKREISQSLYYDGNHLLVLGKWPAWRRQLQLLGAYFRFYNPLNLWRAGRAGGPMRWYRVAFQLAGFVGAVRTAWRMLPYAWRLLVGKKQFHTQAPPLTHVPVRLAPGAFARVPAGVLPTSHSATVRPVRPAA
jgi:radical SAM superfamily enzyme YgiQ (UPF0313 family)